MNKNKNEYTKVKCTRCAGTGKTNWNEPINNFGNGYYGTCNICMGIGYVLYNYKTHKQIPLFEEED